MSDNNHNTNIAAPAAPQSLEQFIEKIPLCSIPPPPVAEKKGEAGVADKAGSDGYVSRAPVPQNFQPYLRFAWNKGLWSPRDFCKNDYDLPAAVAAALLSPVAPAAVPELPGSAPQIYVEPRKAADLMKALSDFEKNPPPQEGEAVYNREYFETKPLVTIQGKEIPVHQGWMEEQFFKITENPAAPHPEGARVLSELIPRSLLASWSLHLRLNKDWNDEQIRALLIFTSPNAKDADEKDRYRQVALGPVGNAETLVQLKEIAVSLKKHAQIYQKVDARIEGFVSRLNNIISDLDKLIGERQLQEGKAKDLAVAEGAQSQAWWGTGAIVVGTMFGGVGLLFGLRSRGQAASGGAVTVIYNHGVMVMTNSPGFISTSSTAAAESTAAAAQGLSRAATTVRAGVFRRAATWVGARLMRWGGPAVLVVGELASSSAFGAAMPVDRAEQAFLEKLGENQKAFSKEGPFGTGGLRLAHTLVKTYGPDGKVSQTESFWSLLGASQVLDYVSFDKAMGAAFDHTYPDQAKDFDRRNAWVAEQRRQFQAEGFQTDFLHRGGSGSPLFENEEKTQQRKQLAAGQRGLAMGNAFD